jgi:hypothetical protein
MENLFLIQTKEHNGLIHNFIYDKNEKKVSIKITTEKIDLPSFLEDDIDDIKNGVINLLGRLHFESPKDILAGNRYQHIENIFRNPMSHADIKRVDVPVVIDNFEPHILLHIIRTPNLFGGGSKYESVLYNASTNKIFTKTGCGAKIPESVFINWLNSLPILVLISFCFPNNWVEYIPKALKISYPIVKDIDISTATEKVTKIRKKKEQKSEESKLEKKWNDLRKWVETVPDFIDKSEKEKINIVNSIMLKKYGKTIEKDTEDLLF